MNKSSLYWHKFWILTSWPSHNLHKLRVLDLHMLIQTYRKKKNGWPGGASQKGALKFNKYIRIVWDELTNNVSLTHAWTGWKWWDWRPVRWAGTSAGAWPGWAWAPTGPPEASPTASRQSSRGTASAASTTEAAGTPPATTRTLLSTMGTGRRPGRPGRGQAWAWVVGTVPASCPCRFWAVWEGTGR